MTTKEIAMSIFNQFTEDELKALITLFSRLYPPKKENEILEPRQELIEENTFTDSIKHT